MHPNFKRKKAVPGRISIHKKWKEAAELKRYIKRQGPEYLIKFKHAPRSVALDFRKHLKENLISFELPMTEQEQITCISDIIDWEINVKPEFKKLLSIAEITEAEFSKMLGYSSSTAWRNTSSRLRLAKGFLAVFNIQKEYRWWAQFKPVARIR